MTTRRDNGLARKLRAEMSKLMLDNEAYERAAVIYALLYGALLLTLWGWKLASYILSCDSETGCSQDRAVFTFASTMAQQDGLRIVLISVAVFALLIVSNLRVILGSLLCHSKESALRVALTERFGITPACLIHFTAMYVFIKTIAFVALVRSYLVGGAFAHWLPFALLLEASLILWFDHVFKRELKKIDPKKRIVRNDQIFFAVAAAWLFVMIADDLPRAVIAFISSYKGFVGAARELLYWLFIGTVGAHVYYFYLEMNQYRASLTESVQTTWGMARKLFGLRDSGRAASTPAASHTLAGPKS